MTQQSQWYKDAIVYELHVRAFQDANADGVGDLRGLLSKLDYLQDLGVTALWLLPFCPSPLKDDGYDIADFTDIHPAYGTLQEFKLVLREAHRRGLRVITELVVNHTSDQHPWFQRARTDTPGGRYRDYYVWSDTPTKYADARIIFKDFESSNWTRDTVASAYYWHRFYAHQPDLNYDNPQVRKAVLKVLDFWFEMGVDGLRLDAIPYLFEREGTSCENLPETHTYLRELRQHVETRFPDRLLLAEANQWPEDAVAYFGQGDECHMAFHFPLMPRLFMAVRLEDRFPILDILAQTPAIPTNCQWAIFLRNHDELTLEMVTDEERDYMYRVYASDPQMRINVGIRRRLAPLLGNNRRKIELLNGLLFALPGTPVIYYGDELGMGDNVYLGDRNGVRTPMQWSGDRNAGFSRANPQQLYLPVVVDPEYHYEAVNVEAQQKNQSSMLWWMKRMLAMRKRYHAFGRGTLTFITPTNRKVLVFLRQHEEQTVLVIANLSRFTQCAELDLSAFQGCVPVELFGQAPFPPIGALPYFVTLGPHAFYWFALEPQRTASETVSTPPATQRPMIHIDGAWTRVLTDAQRVRRELEGCLPAYLHAQRWFGGKARAIRVARLTEALCLQDEQWLTIWQVEYRDSEPEQYLLPLTYVPATEEAPADRTVIARVERTSKGVTSEGWLCDAIHLPALHRALFDCLARRRQIKGTAGEAAGSTTRVFRQQQRADASQLDPRLLGAEQSNTSILYGERYILKLFRRLEAGMNPDLEVTRHLTEQTTFTHVPALAGALEYRSGRHASTSLGMLQCYVPNQGDAWHLTLDMVGDYYERVLAQPPDTVVPTGLPAGLLDEPSMPLPSEVAGRIGSYLEMAALLGARTGELHCALAGTTSDARFAPEPFSALDARSLAQSLRSLTTQVFQTLRQRQSTLSETVQPSVMQLLTQEQIILQRFELVRGRSWTARRIRCHGDYHLGQVLYTGKDFVILDFEGEPAHTLSERRRKRSPLRDVAGMIRSFHYAAYMSVRTIRPEDHACLEPWAQLWYRAVSRAFVGAYQHSVVEGRFLPQTQEELQVLLNLFLLEKGIYELGYELNNRPDWVGVPLHGLTQLLGEKQPSGKQAATI